MSPTIQFDEELHERGERLQVESQALRQALGWWVAAELIRRHPGRMRAIEAHPGGGQYDCISVLYNPLGPAAGRADWQLVVHMNQQPGSTHFAHTGRFSQGDDDDDAPRFNWLEVLLCRDRRSYVVEQLERAAELAAPHRTPATAAETVGPLLISAFVSRTALARREWKVVNGFLDSSTWSEVRDEFFSSFPGADKHRRQRRDDDFLEIPEYRYWFLAEVGSDGREPGQLHPKLVIDTMFGLAWNPDRRFALLQEYDRVGRSLDRLVSRVCPPAF